MSTILSVCRRTCARILSRSNQKKLQFWVTNQGRIDLSGPSQFLLLRLTTEFQEILTLRRRRTPLKAEALQPTMRSPPYSSDLSICVQAFFPENIKGTVQVMNATRTSTHFCTIHLKAKASVSSCSKRNPVEFNFLSLKNKPFSGRQCSLNCLSQSSALDSGYVVVEDDLEAFLKILPYDLQEILRNDPKRAQLLEVILDLGRLPEARYLGEFGGQYLRSSEVSLGELDYTQKTVGEFGADNRAGIEGTLHRVSAIRSRNGVIVGMTCRVGRAVSGHVDMVHDLLQYGKSILFVGRPGVGKTTVMREIARVLSDEFHKRVVIIDTSNEIGGDGNIPHAAIGGARRMQVPDPSLQYRFMIEAIENHMPEVIIVDEISTEIEALACRSIAERGIMLIGTAHGERLGNIIKNQVLTDLIGGIETVTLGDCEARARRTQKSILERKRPPTFYFLIEMRERHHWVVHQTEKSVDKLLCGESPLVEVRKRDSQFKVVIERWKTYDGSDI